MCSETGAAEACCSAWSFGESGDFFEVGFDALNDAELGDAVAGFDLGCGLAEVGNDDADLAAVAGIDDAGECGESSEGEAGTVFDERAVSGWEFKREAGGDGDGGSGRERSGFGGVEVGGEITVGASVGVAGDVGCRVQLLDFDVRHDFYSLRDAREGKRNTTFGGDSNEIGTEFSSCGCVYINSNTTGQTARYEKSCRDPKGAAPWQSVRSI